MFMTEIGEFYLRKALLNRVLNGGWALELDTGAATAEIKTAAIQRMQSGLKKADVATGAITIAAGNTLGAQAVGTTYYVVMLVLGGTLKLYKCPEGEDKFCVADLTDAMDDDEMPLAVIKAVATAAWTPLTDNWSDGDITVTGAQVNGVIPVVKPSDLTFATIVA